MELRLDIRLRRGPRLAVRERVGVLWTYATPAFPRAEIEPCFAELNEAARALNLQMDIAEIITSARLEATLADIGSKKPGALLLTSGPSLDAMTVVMQFAVDRGMPTIIDFDWTFMSGTAPLMCYGPVYRELVRSAARSIDKILRGTRPGDVPIQPSRFELIVNQKTARTMGLSLHEKMLILAYKVIE